MSTTGAQAFFAHPCVHCGHRQDQHRGGGPCSVNAVPLALIRFGDPAIAEPSTRKLEKRCDCPGFDHARAPVPRG